MTLEKKGTLFGEDHFSGAATKKKGEKGSHWTTEVNVREEEWHSFLGCSAPTSDPPEGISSLVLTCGLVKLPLNQLKDPRRGYSSLVV